MKLRPYQRNAVDSIYRFFETHTEGHPLIVAPTGSGKSVIIGTFIKEVIQRYPTQRILVLTHVKELIEQNHQRLLDVWPKAPAGIYSAGLRRRDKAHPIIFAGIQSVHSRFREMGKFDLIIIDEAHLVPKSAHGMYRKFLDGTMAILNPKVRVIGLTATPYRLKGGLLHRGEERLFTDIAYDIPLSTLIQAGHLAPPIAKKTRTEIDVGGIRVVAGEYVAKDLELVADADDVVESAVDEIVEKGANRRSWLVFCVGVKHAEHVLESLRGRGVKAEMVIGETKADDRAWALNEYRCGHLRCLVSVGVLTTGFDAPETDLVALLRPTVSTGLYVQMVGRGMRPAEGKRDCLVLDFGGNVRRHGPVDDVRVGQSNLGGGGGDADQSKVCPSCSTWVFILTMRCPECGHEFEAAEGVLHDAEADDAPVYSGEIPPMPEPVIEEPVEQRRLVDHVYYSVHKKAGKPDSLRVRYELGGACPPNSVSEWVCFEHGGFARKKAEIWWTWRAKEPAELVPRTVSGALELTDLLPVPSAIVIREDGDYWRIIDTEWEDLPGDDDPLSIDWDEIPF